MRICSWAVAILVVTKEARSFSTTQSRDGGNPRVRQGETSLNVFTPPPLIIGPMIRKMREDKAKKRMPLATEEEARFEAPGLRIGNDAWKWPPVWPYDDNFFATAVDLENQPAPNMMALAGMMNSMPTAPDAPAQEEKKGYDAVEFWSQEKAGIETNMDPEAVEKLKQHLAFYLRDGQSVLELGAAEDSYLPEGLKLGRHVGIGLNQELMNENKALTESYVVDLNDIEPQKGVKSDTLKKLSTEPFDAVLMTNTVEYLTHPREVYKSAYYLLKPGGKMIVPFSGRDVFASQFERAQTKIWRDYNDDQHMWVLGSYFQFSAGEGWQNVKGFDISPDSALDAMDDSPMRFLNRGKANNIYVVQATKVDADEAIDPSDPEKSFKSRMWMLPVMEDRDKALVAPRLRCAYEATSTEQERTELGIRVDYLPAVYESLLKMDQFAFTFSMQSQLAVNLVTDPGFAANEEQIDALKQALGLKTPKEDFWAPVGQLTASMSAEDKINLLTHLVPRFGSGDAEQEEALQAFVSGMKPTFDVIRSKCQDFPESDVQLLGTELLAAEILKPGRSSREEFAAWLGNMPDSEMHVILAARKKVKDDADAALVQYRAEFAEKKRLYEEYQANLKKQMETARKERTMAFNSATGKIEPLKK